MSGATTGVKGSRTRGRTKTGRARSKVYRCIVCEKRVEGERAETLERYKLVMSCVACRPEALTGFNGADPRAIEVCENCEQRNVPPVRAKHRRSNGQAIICSRCTDAGQTVPAIHVAGRYQDAMACVLR